MTNQLLSATLDAIDAINEQDPNTVIIDNKTIPKELIYGQRMSDCLLNYWPDASEYLQIAVRAQHIKRWHLKRAEFPVGKAGYFKWRQELGRFHAQLAKSIMIDNGYSEENASFTAEIVCKTKLRTNENSQTLEDVACLVFLMHYFEEFAAKHDDEKVISIVQKTWKKMSDKAHDIALTLTLPAHLGALVSKALA